MGEEIKYEMIFGDEKLFDGAPDECFCVAKNVYGESVYYKAVDACLFWLDGGKWKPLRFMSYPPIAIRRIIKDKVDDENELENLYWEFDSQRSKKTTDERLLFKGKLRYYASIASVDKSTKEPNRWTWEDKKAGRLPEVDWIVGATGINEDARVAAINNDSVCVVFKDGGFITLHVSGISPIETPAEKAQRLRDEWVEHALDLYMSSPKNDFASMGDVHDALLSGELQAPKWE